MRKCGTQRRLAVYPQSLRDNRNNGHQNAHKTVLENSDPDNLSNDQCPKPPQRLLKCIILH